LEEVSVPVYVYKNLKTGETFEYEQRITESALSVHPQTGDPVKRLIQPVGIAFKGSGFYVNDSRNSSGSSTKKADTTSDTSSCDAKADTKVEAKPGAKSEAKTESKSETKAEPKTASKKESKTSSANAS
jgi:predicted nucleic acid-binding Zn ribbon protein